MIGWTDTGTVAGFRLFLVVASMIIGGLAAISTVLAFFGSTWWPFDYLANLRWYFLWILLFASIIYSLTAKGWLLIVFIAALAVNGSLIAPLWIDSQPEATGENSIHVVHLDATGGFDDRNAATSWLIESEADIVLIAGGTSEIINRVVTSDSGWIALVAPEIENTAGQIILAKQEWDIAVTPTGEGADAVLRITVGDTSSAYDIITAWGPIASSAENADRLQARLDTIKAVMQTATNPVVVIGNVGATLWTHGMRDLVSTTDLRDAAKGEGYLSTSNVSGLRIVGGWLGLPLDVVLMTSDITPISLNTGPDVGAENLPVSVIFGPTA